MIRGSGRERVEKHLRGRGAVIVQGPLVEAVVQVGDLGNNLVTTHAGESESGDFSKVLVVSVVRGAVAVRTGSTTHEQVDALGGTSVSVEGHLQGLVRCSERVSLRGVGLSVVVNLVHLKCDLFVKQCIKIANHNK